MFTLYCDDSGTHPKSDIAIAACYISPAEQWKEFKRNWEEVDAREKFGVFHMADFVARQKQFASPTWQDEEKRARTIRALIATINVRAQIGIAAAVIKSAYDEVITDDLRNRLGENHYTFAIRICISLIERWRQRCGHAQPIKYVFDQLSKGKGDIEASMRVAASGGDDAIRRYGIYRNGWAFENKAEHIQLQAPDIWAYENYRYAKDVYFARDGQRARIRESYRALRTKLPTEVRYHTRESLIELVRRSREQSKSDPIGTMAT